MTTAFVNNGRAGLLRILGDDARITKNMFIDRCAKTKSMLRYLEKADVAEVFDECDHDKSGFMERKEYVETLVDVSKSFDYKGAILLLAAFFAFPVAILYSLCRLGDLSRGGFSRVVKTASTSRVSFKRSGYLRGFAIVWGSVIFRSVQIHAKHPFYGREETLYVICTLWWTLTYFMMIASFLTYCFLANNYGWLKDEDRFETNVNLIEACFPIIIYSFMAVQFTLLYIVSDESVSLRMVTKASELQLNKFQFATVQRTTTMSPSNSPNLTEETATNLAPNEDFRYSAEMDPESSVWDRQSRTTVIPQRVPTIKPSLVQRRVSLASQTSGGTRISWQSGVAQSPLNNSKIHGHASSVLKKLGGTSSHSIQDEDIFLLSDTDVDASSVYEHINFVVSTLLDAYIPTDRRYIVMFCLLGPIFLAFMSPILRTYQNQPFFGNNGPGGAFIVFCAFTQLYTCFFAQFYQVVGVLREFTQIRWQMRAFSAILNEGDSAFIYEDHLIEMPFLNLGDANNISSFMELRTFFQIKRVPVVKRTEVVVGIIIAAIISFAIIIVTLLLLGTFWSLMHNIQFTLHGRTVLAILTWGAFLLAIIMIVILLSCVDVNEMQVNHIKTISAMKWKLLTDVLHVEHINMPQFVNEALVHLQRYDSVATFLVQNDVFLGLLGVVFNSDTVKQIVILVVSTIGTGVISFISTGVQGK